jgi:sugar lactone lactonase YvrE
MSGVTNVVDSTLSVSLVKTSPSVAYATTPFWCEITQCLWYCDMFGKEVVCFSDKDETSEKMGFPQQVAFAIPTAFTTVNSTQLFVGLEDKVVEVDWNTKTIVREVLCLPPNTRIVSGKCSPLGTLFVSVVDATKTGLPGHLFSIREDEGGWKIHKLFGGFWNETFYQIPLGMAWMSKHEFYMVDSAYSTISRYFISKDRHGSTGTFELFNFWKEAYYVKKESTLKILSSADNLKYKLEGLTIDHDMMLWVCVSGAGCVLRIDPSSGKELQRIYMDIPNPTALVFGKFDLKILFLRFEVSNLFSKYAGVGGRWRALAYNSHQIYFPLPNLYRRTETEKALCNLTCRRPHKNRARSVGMLIFKHYCLFAVGSCAC